MKTLRIKFPHNEEQELEFGKPVVLLGANGAGKSTILKTISGLLRPRSGIIDYEGQKINGMALLG